MRFKNDKLKLTKAFTKLRNHWYFARQNFMCCQNCAWAEIDKIYEDIEKKYNQTWEWIFLWAVFSHNQAYEVFKEDSYMEEYNSIHLNWSWDAQDICNIIESCWLVVKWDWKETTGIEVLLKN